MKTSIDAEAREVRLELPAALYSEEAVRIAAAVFDRRCAVYHAASRGRRALTLEAARRDADRAALEALAGEFLNELLNQEYRFLVARFNRRVADLVATQTLLSARGGESPAAAPADPALEAEAAKLMAEAAAEIKRTMPARLPPQPGSVLPPEPSRA